MKDRIEFIPYGIYKCPHCTTKFTYVGGNLLVHKNGVEHAVVCPKCREELTERATIKIIHLDED